MTDRVRKAVAGQTDDRPERTVLVVDDVPEIGELYKAMLRRVRNFRVRALVEVRSARAIETLHEGQFDLIITDLRMPGATGRDVIAAARATNPQAPIILMSGYLGSAGDVPGAAAVVAKPLDTSRIVDLIEGLLGGTEPPHLPSAVSEGTGTSYTTSERQLAHGRSVPIHPSGGGAPARAGR